MSLEPIPPFSKASKVKRDRSRDLSAPAEVYLGSVTGPDWKGVVAKQPLNQPFTLTDTNVDLASLTGAPEIPLQFHTSGAAESPVQILMSDGPETLKSPEVPQHQAVIDDNRIQAGVTRIVLDHVNGLDTGPAADKQFCIALENETGKPVNVSLQKVGLSTNAKAMYQRFLDNSDGGQFPGTMTLAPHQRKYLPLSKQYNQGQFLLAMLQLKSDGPLRFQSAIMPRQDSSFVPSYYPSNSFPGTPRIPIVTAPVPPHIRGVFPTPDLISEPATVDIADGSIQGITIDGQGTTWPAGTDDTPGRDHSQKWPPRNEGNYGLKRTYNLALTNSGNSAYNHVAVLVIPGGGSAGVLKQQGGPPTVVQLNRTASSYVQAMAIVNQNVAPGQTVNLKYDYMMTPEYSAPVHLVVVPLSV